MVRKSTALHATRWSLWLCLLWIFARGIASFFPSLPPPTQKLPPTEKIIKEPLGLQYFPVIFAEEYLTWQSSKPDEHASRLRPYLAPGVDGQAGWAPGSESAVQQATGSWTYHVKQVTSTRWMVTVATRVSRSKDGQALPSVTLLLAVPVGVTAEGALAVYDLPTLVPEPPPGLFKEPLFYGQERSDDGDRIRSLLDGFFRAYLGREGSIAYFVVSNYNVTPLRSNWLYEGITHLNVVENDGQVWALAAVTVRDPETSSRYTFRYTLGLAERDGRWYVNQIIQKGD